MHRAQLPCAAFRAVFRDCTAAAALPFRPRSPWLLQRQSKFAVYQKSSLSLGCTKALSSSYSKGSRVAQGTPASGNSVEKKSEGTRRAERVQKSVMAPNTPTPVKSSVSFVQIMGTGLDIEDTAPSVMLFMENPLRRFIFNAGEGLQRYCMEHKVPFMRIDNILLTRVCTETAGGLPGLLLTLANNMSSVNIMGPSNLQKLVDAMRTFIPGTVVRAKSFGESLHIGNSNVVSESKILSNLNLLPVYKDETVDISAVILVPENLGKLRKPSMLEKKDEANLYEKRDPSTSSGTQQLESGNGKSEGRLRGESEDGRKYFEAEKEEETVVVQAADLAVVYVCELPTVQGKFDPKKAMALGLRPGKKYGLLQKGISVESDDGTRKIHPLDVMSPPIPGPILLLVDCPSADHLPSLLISPGLEQFYEAAGGNVRLAIHLGPHSIVQRDEYRRWMARFGKETNHILAGHGRNDVVSPIMAASAKVTARLNLLCPRVFPAYGLGLDESTEDKELKVEPGQKAIGKEERIPLDTIKEEKVLDDVGWEANLGPIILSENLLKFQLQPSVNARVDRTAVPKPLFLQSVREDLCKEQPEVLLAAQQIAALWEQRTDGGKHNQEAKEIGEDSTMDYGESNEKDLEKEMGTVAKRQRYVEEPWLNEDAFMMEPVPVPSAASSLQTEVKEFRDTANPLVNHVDILTSQKILGTIETKSSLEPLKEAVDCLADGSSTDKIVSGVGETPESPKAGRRRGRRGLKEVAKAKPVGNLQNNGSSMANEVCKGEVDENRGIEIDERAENIPNFFKKIGRRRMEIVFLGTGSSMPSKYRNVSAIYVHLFDQGGIMLDCGEGTYGQLRRRYGNQGADEIISKLGLIWISHIHADHHVGMLRILAVRQSLLGGLGRCPPLLVVGPRQLKPLLDAYQQLENLSAVFLDCSQTTKMAEAKAKAKEEKEVAALSAVEFQGIPEEKGGLVQFGERGGSPRRRMLQPFWQQAKIFPKELDLDGRRTLVEVLHRLGLQRLESVEVSHCNHAYGVVIESIDFDQKSDIDTQEGWKLAYSGDTRPCQSLVDASQGATVLIHEATFDDEMQEDAINKRHSMTKEAVEVGVLAGAYRTILTHFSQRYPKIPVIDASYTDRTCIAFDMMSANMADLPFLPKLLPALKILFKEEIMEAEEAKESREVD